MSTNSLETRDKHRRSDLAVIHMAARLMFGDVRRGGAAREAYEAWLHDRTGQLSAADLTRAQRRDLVAYLRAQGAIPDRQDKRTGADRRAKAPPPHPSRPTKAQWAKIGALARTLGMDGLSDPALASFMRRTVKVDALRFMTRSQASQLIVGLTRWSAGRAGHEPASAALSAPAPASAPASASAPSQPQPQPQPGAAPSSEQGDANGLP